MRRFRVYTERTNLRVGSSVKLPDFEAEHLRKSLRVKKGDEIFIFNGEKEFRAHLTLVSKDAVMAEIDGVLENEFDQAQKIHLIQALNKSKSFEFTLEKATEIGVDSILPIETEYSVVKASDITPKKIDRWDKIILSACKQSERITIPKIFPAINIADLDFSSYDLILFLSTEEKSNAKEINNFVNEIQNARNIAVIVGPEGGFSKSEVDLMLKNKNVVPVSINKNILRSETAAIVVLGYLKIIIS
ncbi:16S rRNA (uracil(1498)-N(3))-methyltransferase [Candidatus Dojkabacteria bacterium]|uniref:Ribosomal RNA small subunit methyltransferase E n=1 Tax=Candidatus Dojkabacteria bacterium TaxID=2099670 RepID=A0A955RMD8_9BACT|nr:16S rRNA (uracil(1498)-N(3))-methyltransferase [Candidatus Dojkabacteria bacterium]